jgi:hypothetical protein
MQLILRRANVSRKGGPWSETDYDGFNGDRNVGPTSAPRGLPGGAIFDALAILWGRNETSAGRDYPTIAPEHN